MEAKIFDCTEQMLRVFTKKVVKVLADGLKEDVKTIVLKRTSRDACEYILTINNTHRLSLLGYWNDCISGAVHIPFRDGIVFPFYDNSYTLIEPRMLDLVNKIFDWGYDYIKIK